LKDKRKRDKINEVIANEEGIAMASEVLISISKDEVERARLMSEYKYVVDLQSKVVQAEREGIQKGRQEGLQKGRQEGLQKGRKEGLQQGKLEIAKALKDIGDPIEKIVRVTGLTEQQINGL
jgi:predicted transposase/invertase (TIGR01784 family)